MAINETGIDYSQASGLLAIGGGDQTLTVADLGIILTGQASGTTLAGTRQITLANAGADERLVVGESFVVTNTFNPTLGPQTTSTLELTMLGTGTFRGTVGSVLGVNPRTIIVGQAANGSVYVIFPDGDMPSGLLDGLVGGLVTTVNIEPVGYDFVANAPLCFARGTMLEIPDGLRTIEELRVGDLVVTKDNGAQPVRWIGSRTISAATLQAHPHLRPIRISAGALGSGTPTADLVVSPQHRILVRSSIAQRMFGSTEVLVAAKQLVLLDGIDIADDMQGVEYFHVMFEQHEVVFANGAETESLFTGPEAIKSVGAAARIEILEIFPKLAEESYEAVAARILASGRSGRRMAQRHVQNKKVLVQ